MDAVDHEGLRCDLSDALDAIQEEHGVVGLNVLASSLDPRWSGVAEERMIAAISAPRTRPKSGGGPER